MLEIFSHINEVIFKGIAEDKQMKDGILIQQNEAQCKEIEESKSIRLFLELLNELPSTMLAKTLLILH